MNLLEMFPSLSLNEINPIPFVAKFESDVAGSIESGKITWDLVETTAHRALSGSMYFLNNISFNMGLNQDVLLNALDPDYNNGFIHLDIISEDDKETYNKQPIKFANYVNDKFMGIAYQSRRSSNRTKSQNIKYRLSGQILQTADIITHLSSIGKTTLDAYIVADIYGITNQQWIKEYFLQGRDY